MMSLTLNAFSNELDADDLQSLTRELCSAISNETEIEAEIPVSENKNVMGEVVTVGMMILKFFSNRPIFALFQVLKAYLSRDPSLSITATKTDGTKLEINAQNITPEKLQSFLAQLDDKHH